MYIHKQYTVPLRGNVVLIIFLVCCLFFMAVTPVYAGSIIANTASDGYAWNSYGGWVNFKTPQGAVEVTDTAVTGYAWDMNYGWLNLSPTNGGVINDGSGNLSGYAWSAGGGWVSFSGVTIDSDGVFHGQTPASNTYGVINFDCTYCNVVTDWRSGSGGSTGGMRGRSDAAVSPALLNVVSVPEQPVTAVPVTEGEGATTTTTEGAGASSEGAPEELFDIRLVIDNRQLLKAQELVARTTSESFGRVPTPVDVIFTIIDSSGNELYVLRDNVVIETEGVLVTRFTDAPVLPLGTYILKLHTQYNVDVSDDFEISFEIVEKREGTVMWWLIGILAGVMALILVLITGFRYLNKDIPQSTSKKEKEKKKEEGEVTVLDKNRK